MNIVYTVGITEIYEAYISKDPVPEKAAGGSVWETREKAQTYLERCGLTEEFRVYGVVADWEKDTTAREGQEWNNLIADSLLIRLDE
jgi:hypothetical protein